jgi:hypothetical protein
MDEEAHDLYANWCNHLFNQLEKEHRQGVKAVLSKLRKYTAELALLLHLINHEQPDHYLGIETVKQAIHLAQFYLDQILSVHLDSEGSKHELSPKLKAIVEFSQGKGWITARDVQRGSHKRKFKGISAPEIRQLFTELEELGYGITQGINNSTQYRNLEEGDTGDTGDNPPQSLIDRDSSCHQVNDATGDNPLGQEDMVSQDQAVTNSVTDTNPIGNKLPFSNDKGSEKTVATVTAVTRNPETLIIEQNKKVLFRYGFKKGFIEKAIAQIDQTEVNDPPQNIKIEYGSYLWEIQLLNHEKAIGRCYPSEANKDIVTLIGSKFDIEPTLSQEELEERSKLKGQHVDLVRFIHQHKDQVNRVPKHPFLHLNRSKKDIIGCSAECVNWIVQSSNQDLKNEIAELKKEKGIIVCLKQINKEGKEEQYQDIDWDQKSLEELRAINQALNCSQQNGK